MSRRSFLAGLAAAAVSASLDPFEFVSTTGRLYRNSRLGLTATLPAGWEYGSIADFVALRERQLLLDEVAGVHHPLKRPEDLPVFLFGDALNRSGLFTPAIGLFDDSTSARPEDPVARHREVMDMVGRSYRGYERLSEPHSLRLGTASATTADWAYVHELDDSSYHLWVRTYLVRRNGRIHTMHLVDDRHERRVRPEVWEDFADSVRFD